MTNKLVRFEFKIGWDSVEKRLSDLPDCDFLEKVSVVQVAEGVWLQVYKTKDDYEYFGVKWVPPNNPVAKYKNLEINEWSSGFEIKGRLSQKTHWMGDGVDMYFEEGEEGDDCHIAISPGTPRFYELMQQDLEADYDSYLEAYFPEYIKFTLDVDTGETS